jgi:hypothetical protein
MSTHYFDCNAGKAPAGFLATGSHTTTHEHIHEAQQTFQRTEIDVQFYDACLWNNTGGLVFSANT